MSNFESPSQRARREGVTLCWVYSRLAAGRIPGAVKVDGQWRLPVEHHASVAGLVSTIAPSPAAAGR